MERRRRAAEILLHAGYAQASIAAYLNVTQGTVSRWSRRMGKTGKKGRPRRGQNPDAIAEGLISPEARLSGARRPRFLTRYQIRYVAERKPKWRAQEFTDALFATYGVSYSRSQASAVLAALDQEQATPEGAAS
jgi:transposase